MGTALKRTLRILAAASAGAVILAGIGGIFLCESALHPSRRQVPALPAQTPGKLVTIQAAGGARLVAWFLRPAAETGACVVILHGIADNRASSLGFAPIFLEKGYTVLLPDSRGHGESGGELVSYGVVEKWDVLAWVRWLRSAGCREIFGLGESLGAAILLEAAAEQPAFRAIVAECPFATLRRVAEDRLVQRLAGPAWFRRATAQVLVGAGFGYTRLRYGLDLDAAAPVRSVERLATPVLLIAGSRDTNISADHARAIAAVGRSVTLWIVPGAGHTAAAAADPEGFKQRVLSHCGA